VHELARVHQLVICCSLTANRPLCRQRVPRRWQCSRTSVHGTDTTELWLPPEDPTSNVGHTQWAWSINEA